MRGGWRRDQTLGLGEMGEGRNGRMGKMRFVLCYVDKEREYRSGGGRSL